MTAVENEMNGLVSAWQLDVSLGLAGVFVDVNATEVKIGAMEGFVDGVFHRPFLARATTAWR